MIININQMKYLRLGGMIFLLICMLTACRSTKKIGQAIMKKDTLSVPVTHVPSLADTLQFIGGVVDSMRARQTPYSFFSARMKVEYANRNGKQPDFLAYVRLKKDSLIWLSLANDLGIEGIRMLITPDTIKVLDKLAKTIQVRPLNSLQEISQIPFSFADLQKILLGEAVMFDALNVNAYAAMPAEFILFSQNGSLKNSLHINPSFCIDKSRLDDTDALLNRRADLFYKEYEWKNGFAFSTLREIFISHKDIFNVQMKFKEYHFDELLSFPFTIPKKFKKIP